jgi:hypothetical protein
LNMEFGARPDSQIGETRKELAKVLIPEQAQRWKKTFSRIKRFWLPPLSGDSPGPLQRKTNQ